MNKRQRKKQAKKQALRQKNRENFYAATRLLFAERMSKHIFGHISPLYMRLAGVRREED